MDPSSVSNESYCAILCSYKDKCKAFKAYSTELEAYAWHSLDLDKLNPILQYL